MDHRKNSWPLKPQTPYPVTPDGSLPVEYQTVLDPLDVLTYVAANTSKSSLGTSVVAMFSYTPIMLAKRYATLDVLSQGRVRNPTSPPTDIALSQNVSAYRIRQIWCH